MLKLFSLMFFVLFFVSCNKDGGSGTDCSQAQQALEVSTDCTVTVDPPVTGDDTNVGTVTGGGTAGSNDGTTSGSSSGGNDGASAGGLPNEAYTFDTNIKFLNASSAQLAKFQKAIDIIKDVVATEEFRSAVLNHTYGGKKTFVDNAGFTNAQIYQKILDAAEKLQPVKNNTIDMAVELYYASNSTVGYTYPNTTQIWVNTKFFNIYTPSSVAGNLFHEWLHKLGFGHASSYTPSRDYSVPYAIGYMIRNMGKNFE